MQGNAYIQMTHRKHTSHFSPAVLLDWFALIYSSFILSTIFYKAFWSPLSICYRSFDPVLSTLDYFFRRQQALTIIRRISKLIGITVAMNRVNTHSSSAPYYGSKKLTGIQLSWSYVYIEASILDGARHISVAYVKYVPFSFKF